MSDIINAGGGFSCCHRSCQCVCVLCVRLCVCNCVIARNHVLYYILVSNSIICVYISTHTPHAHIMRVFFVCYINSVHNVLQYVLRYIRIEFSSVCVSGFRRPFRFVFTVVFLCIYEVTYTSQHICKYIVYLRYVHVCLLMFSVVFRMFLSCMCLIWLESHVRGFCFLQSTSRKLYYANTSPTFRVDSKDATIVPHNNRWRSLSSSHVPSPRGGVVIRRLHVRLCSRHVFFSFLRFFAIAENAMLILILFRVNFG